MSDFDVTNTVDIHSLTLESHSGDIYDIKNFFREFNIYGSIYKGSMTANMLIIDPVNMLAAFPVIGGEKVTIKWKTAGYKDYQKMEWRIESIGERVRNGKNASYWVHLITVDQYRDLSKATSIGMDGTYSDLIKRMLSELNSRRPQFITDTVGVHKIATPLWTPFQITHHYVKKSHDENRLPMAFYEDLDGYHLSSVDTLLGAPSIDRLFFQQEGLDLSGERVFRNVKGFDITESFNVADRNQMGVTRNIEYVYNPRTRSTVRNDRILADFDSSRNKLGKHRINSDTTDHQNVRSLINRTDGAHESDYGRLALTTLLNNFTTKVKCIGDSELRLGGVYDFNIPSPQPNEDGEQRKERFVSGRFIVTEVKHQIKPSVYFNNITLAKESYNEQANIGVQDG